MKFCIDIEIVAPEGYTLNSDQKNLVPLWKRELERIGIETVRARLTPHEVGISPGAFVEFVRVKGPEGKTSEPPRWFVEAWLAAHGRRAQRRSNLQHSMLWVATIAAVLGAIFSFLQFFIR